jgi:hypothetical protein
MKARPPPRPLHAGTSFLRSRAVRRCGPAGVRRCASAGLRRCALAVRACRAPALLRGSGCRRAPRGAIAGCALFSSLCRKRSRVKPPKNCRNLQDGEKTGRRFHKKPFRTSRLPVNSSRSAHLDRKAELGAPPERLPFASQRGRGELLRLGWPVVSSTSSHKGLSGLTRLRC